MAPVRLTETISEWQHEFSVDHAAQIVRNVALTGRESKNGYTYSEAALVDAVNRYEHKPVFLDHSADRNRPKQRSTRDLVGSICNARYVEGRIRGDIRVLDTESGRTFMALVSSDAPGVGMSHVVLAAKSADGATVEKIHDVVSVDAVIHPATTTTFRESASEPDAVASAPEDVAVELSPQSEVNAGQLLEQMLEQLRTEFRQLREQYDALAEKVTSQLTAKPPAPAPKPAAVPRSRERQAAVLSEDAVFVSAIRRTRS